jgi:small conductance mechanosensitive channel
MDNLETSILAVMPTFFTLCIAVTVLVVADRRLLRRAASQDGKRKLTRQLTLLTLTGVAILVVALTLPIAESTRNQLLALSGLVLTALLTLASTTFVANAMAGVMLQSVRNFNTGDFLRVGEHFGRVTERGLFHTEVQTEDSDLTTLPNLLLVSNPVTVVRSQGTIVSANVSLGYDKPHALLEPILCDAALSAELEKPFVQIVELADHAVIYRVAGLLSDVKFLLTARSNLRKSILDSLHAAQIEIVSPTFVNQRRLAGDGPIIPERDSVDVTSDETLAAEPETIVFDKADAAARVEELKTARNDLTDEIAELEEQLKKASESEKHQLEQGLAGRKIRLLKLQEMIESTEAENP